MGIDLELIGTAGVHTLVLTLDGLHGEVDALTVLGAVESGTSHGTLLVVIALAIVFHEGVRRLALGEHLDGEGIDGIFAYEVHVALHGDDRALTHEEQTGTTFRDIALHGASTLYAFTIPEVGPFALGQINLIAEYSYEEVLAKHILIAGIVDIAVGRELERHRPYNRHTSLRTLDGGSVDVRQQTVA